MSSREKAAESEKEKAEISCHADAGCKRANDHRSVETTLISPPADARRTPAVRIVISNGYDFHFPLGKKRK